MQHFVRVCERNDKNMDHNRKSESNDVIADWTFTDTPSAVVLFDGWVNSLYRDQEKDAADEVVNVDQALYDQDR